MTLFEKNSPTETSHHALRSSFQQLSCVTNVQHPSAIRNLIHQHKNLTKFKRIEDPSFCQQNQVSAQLRKSSDPDQGAMYQCDETQNLKCDSAAIEGIFSSR